MFRLIATFVDLNISTIDRNCIEVTAKISAADMINYIFMYKLNTSMLETGCSLSRTSQDYFPTPLILV